MAKYSDVQRAETMAVLAANGGNLNKTARNTGIPLSTLAKWADGKGHSPDHADLCMEKKKDLAELFEGIARDILDAAADKIADASLKDAMVSAGVAVDKMQLLKNEPTSITKSVNERSPADARRELADLLFAGRVGSGSGGTARGEAGVSAGADCRSVPAVN